MLKLSIAQIDAIRNSELSVKLANDLESPRLMTQSLSELAQDDIDCLWDACIDELTNEAPAIEVFTAEQDVGPYHVGIRRVPGGPILFLLLSAMMSAFSQIYKKRAPIWIPNMGSLSSNRLVRALSALARIPNKLATNHKS
jgi:hypothetical protein